MWRGEISVWRRYTCETGLTHSIPVSTNTYSRLFQSRRANNPMVFELETQTNAERSLDDGSKRKTFITTPIVRNDARRENVGGGRGFVWPVEEDGSMKDSGNSSFMRTKSMRRSSYLWEDELLSEPIREVRENH